jgi:lipopolysaccharide export system permease protein
MNVAAMLTAVKGVRREIERTRANIDSTSAAFLQQARTDTAGDLRDRGRRLAASISKNRRLLHSRQRRANAYLVEVHKKFSIAVACAIFALVGAPVGALVRARGAAVSVTVSLLFFFAYWMFLIGGERLADRGFVSPAAAMWAPNVVFGIMGVMLVRAQLLDRPLLGLRERMRRPRSEP